MGRKNYQGGTFTVIPDGERLKALRAAYPKRPPQHEIEEMAGISRGQLTRYETNKPASAADLKKLAELYGVEPAELLAPEGLAMCNDILEEMCLFTNKTVVQNTNGNSSFVKGMDWGVSSPTSPNTPEEDLESSHEKENATNQQSLEETETIEV